jgi:2-polyprenyl-6-methoxyphenol hydroxylase-like FAD-dependent oxidoreductase
VIGAGPVGLAPANLLAGYGVRVAVYDRANEPAQFSRAAVVHARTLETLEPIGIVARDDLDQAILVRPDGYIAGCSAPADYAKLLSGLDRALAPTATAAIAALR